jgi:DNA-binding GntR family transcriptional regulator
MLSESEVSEPLGISRTPVREAFVRLANEGTLKLFPKRGALIIPVTAHDVRDVMEARLLIEPWAASVLAGNGARAPVVENLRTLLASLKASVDHRSILEFQEADRSFHETIVASTGNRVVDAFYRSLRDKQLRMGATALVENDGRVASILTEHLEILEAIARGDGESVAQMVRHHIHQTRVALETRPWNDDATFEKMAD